MDNNFTNNTQQPVQPQYQQPVQPQVQPQYQQPQVQVQTQYQQPQPNVQPQFAYTDDIITGANNQMAPAPRKKSKKPLIICLCALVLLIVAGLLIYFLVIAPKKKSDKASNNNPISVAIEKTFSDQSALTAYLGTSDLIRNMSEKPYSTGFSLTLDSLSVPGLEKITPFLGGISLKNGSLITDPKTKDFKASVTLNYSVIDITEVSITHKDDIIAVALPGLLPGYVYSTESDRNNSQSQTTMPPINLPSIPNMPDLSKIDLSVFENVKPALEKLTSSATIASIEGKDITTTNGIVVPCKGYSLTVTKENIHDFIEVPINDIIEILRKDSADRSAQITSLEEGLQKIKEQVAEDFVLEFYINADGYLMQAVLPTLTFDKVSIGAVCDLTGANKVTDQIDCVVTMTIPGTTEEFKFTKTTTETQTSSNTTIRAYIDGSTVLSCVSSLDTQSGYCNIRVDAAGASLSTAGTFSNVQEGTSFAYACDYITVQAGDLYVSLSGNLDIKPATGSITLPSGTGYNFANDADKEAFIKELQTGLLKNPVIMNLFSAFMQGFSF